MQRESPPRSDTASGPPSAGSTWAALPHTDVPRFSADTLRQHWAQLHRGQGQPALPSEELLEGWACYHSGDFQGAVAHGHQHGQKGVTLINMATAVYANYLEPREAVRLQLLRQVAERAALQAAAQPDDPQAFYWQAYALGHYAQGISVARALAQGLGHRVKRALERVIELQPEHPDAHIALALFHAEVVDKVGPLVARMTHGARADTALELLDRGMRFNTELPGALIESARCLLMLKGDAALAEATRLYEQAAALTPADARQRLDVELARAGLSD